MLSEMLSQGAEAGAAPCARERPTQMRQGRGFLRGTSRRGTQEGGRSGDALWRALVGRQLQPAGAGRVGRAQLALLKRVFLQGFQAPGLLPQTRNLWTSTYSNCGFVFVYPRQIFPSLKGKFVHGNPYLRWF